MWEFVGQICEPYGMSLTVMWNNGIEGVHDNRDISALIVEEYAHIPKEAINMSMSEFLQFMCKYLMPILFCYYLTIELNNWCNIMYLSVVNAI